MGNSQSNISLQELKGKTYEELSKESKGYAVLLGNEPQDSSRRDEGVGTRLGYFEESLTSLGKLEVMTPFVSNNASNNTKTAGFTKEQFQRVCVMHFDTDMLSHLSKYSSYFILYSGRSNSDGVLTKNDQCVPFHEIISSICSRSAGHGKPTIFIFDCVFDPEATPTDVRVVMETLTDKLHSLPNDTLVCVTSQTGLSEESPASFTLELAQVYEEFSSILSLPSLLVMAGLRVGLGSKDIVQRPIMWNTLTDELMIGNTDSSLPVSLDIQYWSDYCHTVIKQQSGAPLPLPEATPGCGRRIFIIYSPDSTGRGLESSPVWSLGKWLTSLGFDVFLDCPDPEERMDWYRWYATHVTSCKNIIFVCSPQICQSFDNIKGAAPKRYTVACQLVVSLSKRLKSKEDRLALRLFPVLLSPFSSVEAVPGFFAPGGVYNLAGGGPPGAGSFDSGCVRSDYDALVFHISRLPVPTPQPQPQPAVRENKPVNKVPTPQPQPQPSVRENKPVNKDPQSIVITDEMIDDLLVLKEGYIPVHRTTPLPVKPVIPVPSPPVYTSPPHPPPPPQQPAPLRLSPSVAKEQVSQSALLWLARRVGEWKFVGRHLGLEEYQLTRIERENQHDIGEQVVQMLYAWKQSFPEDDSNQRILDSLRYAESAKMCQEFINYLERK